MKTSCCNSRKIREETDYYACMNSDCSNYMRPTVTYSRKNVNLVFILAFLIFFFVFSYNDFSYDSKLSSPVLRKTLPGNSIPLNTENLRIELDKNHIVCPEQVYAQILIESGHLKSFLSQRTNNLLGMRYPFKRNTTAIGIFLPESNLIIKGSQAELKKYSKQNNYAVYASWEDCIKDYKYWQDKSFKLTERYLTFLGDCYAEDPFYVSKIRNITEKNN